MLMKDPFQYIRIEEEQEEEINVWLPQGNAPFLLLLYIHINILLLLSSSCYYLDLLLNHNSHSLFSLSGPSTNFLHHCTLDSLSVFLG